ncbi:MAG: hypothetical protein R3D28_11595 [Geminicoccaceae bacterium]
MSARGDALQALVVIGVSLAAWFWRPTFAGGGDGRAIMPRLAASAGRRARLPPPAGRQPLARRRPAGGHDPFDPTDDPFLEVDGEGEPPRLLLIIAVWSVILAFPAFFGLHLGNAIGIALTFLILGVVNPVTVLIWSILPIAALHAVFAYGFSLRLPYGKLISLLTGS